MDMQHENTIPPMPDITVVIAHRPDYNQGVQRRQAFRYEGMPDGAQQRAMRRFAGSCRFVFNKGLALQKERFAQGEQKLGYAGLCQSLREWKRQPTTGWLAAMPAQALQQALKDLERAYAN